MQEEQEPIVHEPLFLGFSCPPTLLGAPYGYTVASFIATAVLFLLVKNPLALIVFGPLLVMGRLLVRYDPYGIQALQQNFKLRTRLFPFSRHWNKRYRWRIVSVAPLEHHRPKRKKAWRQ